jgi:LysM repeat protein
MLSTVNTIRTLAAVLCGAWLCGCTPSISGASNEEKEPHYLLGKSRVNAMDFKGAIESFERALEVNPRSAAAHFELGWLLAQKESDPAAAIYHYQRYLKLRPDADNASIITQHIQVLKQDLARNVLPPSVTPAVQREIEQLAEENRRLREDVDKWRAYYASQGIPTNRPPPAGVNMASRPADTVEPSDGSNLARRTTAPARTHRVQSGDTLSSIARKYSVKLETLKAANPQVNPTSMQVGHLVNIPAP